MGLIGQMESDRAVVSFFLQDLDGGGAERAIIRLAGEVALKGYMVDLVVGYADTDYRSEVNAQVNLIDFGCRSPVVIFPKLVAYLHGRSPLVVMSALDPANIMLLLASRLARFHGRIIVSQRAVLDASLRDLGAVRRLITRFFMKVLFPHADAVISNSRAAAYELNHRLGIPSERIYTIHNAIDTALIRRLAKEPLDKFIWPDNQRPLVVSVGSLTKRKDVATLIRAFNYVILNRAARLVIIGEGPERSSLQVLIQELELENDVYLAGFDANPYKWIAAASVFVSASTEEGFPNVVAESLALGCPIVATDCPGDTAELLGHGKWGRLVSVGDAESMSKAILDTIDDPNPPNGLAYASGFTPSSNASAYLNVLLSQRASTFSEQSEVE